MRRGRGRSGSGSSGGGRVVARPRLLFSLVFRLRLPLPSLRVHLEARIRRRDKGGIRRSFCAVLEQQQRRRRRRPKQLFSLSGAGRGAALRARVVPSAKKPRRRRARRNRPSEAAARLRARVRGRGGARRRLGQRGPRGGLGRNREGGRRRFGCCCSCSVVVKEREKKQHTRSAAFAAPRAPARSGPPPAEPPAPQRGLPDPPRVIALPAAAPRACAGAAAASRVGRGEVGVDCGRGAARPEARARVFAAGDAPARRRELDRVRELLCGRAPGDNLVRETEQRKKLLSPKLKRRKVLKCSTPFLLFIISTLFSKQTNKK